MVGTRTFVSGTWRLATPQFGGAHQLFDREHLEVRERRRLKLRRGRGAAKIGAGRVIRAADDGARGQSVREREWDCGDIGGFAPSELCTIDTGIVITLASSRQGSQSQHHTTSTKLACSKPGKYESTNTRYDQCHSSQPIFETLWKETEGHGEIWTEAADLHVLLANGASFGSCAIHIGIQ